MGPDATPLLTLPTPIDTIALPAAAPNRRGRPPILGERL